MTVHKIENSPVILMDWAKTNNTQDIQSAYHDVMEVVNHSNDDVYLMLDMSANSDVSIRDLLNGALNGPYTDPRVAKWLVIGKGETSRSLANTLFFITGEHKVVWFEDQDGAYDYLENLGWHIQH